MAAFRMSGVFVLVMLVVLKCEFSAAHNQLQASSSSTVAQLLFEIIGELNEVQSENKLMSEKIEKLEEKLDTLETPHEGTEVERKDVFFNAKLTAHTTITSGHTVIFDKVMENVGGGYNGLTGIFRAPSRGKYLFSLSLLSQSVKAKYVHTLLLKNGSELGRTFAGSDASNWGQMGSITIVTQLEKGDTVYAKQMNGPNGDLHGDFYCSFSGVKIY